MKKTRQNYLTIAVIAALFLSGCAGLTKMRDKATTVTYKVTPDPLAENADVVKMKVDVTFPEKYFNKKAVVVATPVLKYEGGETPFTPVTLQGEKVQANNKVIAYAGGNFSTESQVAYKPEMMKSTVVVKFSARIKDKTPVEYESAKIADGVVATPTLVVVDPKTITMPDKFQRVIPETYTADIHYLINNADVRKTELKSDEIKAFQQKLADAKATPNKQIKDAKISAYASPDGPLELNTKLSAKRETSAQKYFTKAMKDNKITEAEAEKFLSLMTTPEDWDGFKAAVEKSNIDDKDLILRVLSMYSDPVVREKEIKNISKAYTELAKDVLPTLRRSVMSVDVDVVGKTDDELLTAALSNPSSLQLEEILHAGFLAKTAKDKAAIYQAATTQFPTCFRAKNNLGDAQVQLGNVADAKTSFEASKAINDNVTVKANLGAVALAQGDLKGAEELLTAAMSAGDAVSYNLGIIKIKQGDYAAAVNYFGNKPSFDAALAQLLNGGNDKAMATLNALGDTKDAWVYYLKAVASARGGNADAVVANLRTAASLDAKVKAYAAKDAEFLKFASTDAFKQVIQ
jgi:tetratricopeptide (TPR) repeat protein